MLKIVHPYKREVATEDSIAFRAPCMCNIELKNYAWTRDLAPGCNCSCIGAANRDANYTTARDY